LDENLYLFVSGLPRNGEHFRPPDLAWSFDRDGSVYTLEELFPNELLRPKVEVFQYFYFSEIPFRLVTSIQGLQDTHSFGEGISPVLEMLEVKPIQYTRTLHVHTCPALLMFVVEDPLVTPYPSKTIRKRRSWCSNWEFTYHDSLSFEYVKHGLPTSREALLPWDIQEIIEEFQWRCSKEAPF
jgi:hypothetical protein